MPTRKPLTRNELRELANRADSMMDHGGPVDEQHESLLKAVRDATWNLARSLPTKWDLART